MNASKIFRFVLFALAGAGVSAAQEELKLRNPAVKLGKTLDAVLNVFYDDACLEAQSERKKSEVLRIMDENYDWSVLIRYVVGPNWKRFRADEQDRFVNLVEKLFINNCLDFLKGKRRPVLKFGKNKTSGKRVEVPFVVSFEDEPIKGVFRFALRPSGWEIYDIVVENISFGKNYRQQLNDHFRKGTVTELIEKLEELLEKQSYHESSLL